MLHASNTTLLERLETAVQACYQQSHVKKADKLYAKFDRTLFSEDFQSLAFYQQEIQATLAQLKNLTYSQQEVAEFLTEKLFAQCRALREATFCQASLLNQQTSTIKNPQVPLSRREQIKQQIHQLPPRERLVKYYDALQALNDKIAQQDRQRLQSSKEAEKAYFSQQLQLTLQRKKRCLEAIELLEEYLTFAATKED